MSPTQKVKGRRQRDYRLAAGMSRDHLDINQIFHRHAPYVWRSLRYLGVAERDLEDQVQEVFIRVARSLDSFEGRSTLRTWIYGICLRMASDYRRLARVRREVPVPELPDDQPAPGSQAHSLEARELLLGALAQLPPDQREVFVLYEIEELEMKEIVEMLEVPLFTGYSRLRAARKAVRQYCQVEGGDE